MLYYNLNNKKERVTFREAVTRGISSDMGLFMPEEIPSPGPDFFKKLPEMELPEIAFTIAGMYIGDEIPYRILKTICDESFNFPVVIKKIGPGKTVLELFHGPTAAFKDFGARFMSRCLGYFTSGDDRKSVVLVATSGDTGGAVADSFAGVDAVDVIILYPSGRISPLQENQLTTHGGNITALEITGTFDDCQQMVRETFTKLDTRNRIRLTSANSINIARLIPQSFYYYYAMSRSESTEPVLSVPSGNFGNLSAAVMAWRSGLKVKHFIASTNVNRVVPEYIRTGKYCPANTVMTIANAMDVGNPGNFVRLAQLFDNDHGKFISKISGYWFDDDRIRNHIWDEYQRSGYILDPHGAVASLGLESYIRDHPGAQGIFTATAHPAKFSEVVEPVIGERLTFPASLDRFLSGKKLSVPMNPGYQYLKEYLTERYHLQ
ncbi:MAG: threonine synthase [Bacteroidales bacterium]|jgi:threonine synthase|nr:threonine synthase [Bacteroidales bacterium]